MTFSLTSQHLSYSSSEILTFYDRAYHIVKGVSPSVVPPLPCLTRVTAFIELGTKNTVESLQSLYDPLLCFTLLLTHSCNSKYKYAYTFSFLGMRGNRPHTAFN